MTRWDAGQYLRHAGARLRPAIDLLARIDLEAPATAVDLGCGTGTSTRLLAERWPGCRVTGIDASPDMLARARAEAGDIDWILGDIGTWTADRPVDLLFSNAALHWLPDHSALLPRLFSGVAAGGVLAMQVPRFGELAAHRAIEAVAAGDRWRSRLGGAIPARTVLSPVAYFDLLAGPGVRPDIWETDYLQVLDGPDPVLDWTRGTALRPYLSALDSDMEARSAFLDDCRAALAEAYPRRADGTTLFPFRRLFLVAAKAA